MRNYIKSASTSEVLNLRKYIYFLQVQNLMPNTNEEDQRIVLVCLFTGKNPDHVFAPWPVLLSSNVEHLISMPENI